MILFSSLSSTQIHGLSSDDAQIVDTNLTSGTVWRLSSLRIASLIRCSVVAIVERGLSAAGSFWTGWTTPVTPLHVAGNADGCWSVHDFFNFGDFNGCATLISAATPFKDLNIILHHAINISHRLISANPINSSLLLLLMMPLWVARIWMGILGGNSPNPNHVVWWVQCSGDHLMMMMGIDGAYLGPLDHIRRLCVLT